MKRTILIALALMSIAATPKPNLRRAVSDGVGVSVATAQALQALRTSLDLPGQECGGQGRAQAMRAARVAATQAFAEPQALRLVADAVDVLQGVCEAPELATRETREKVVRRLFSAERGAK